MTPLRAIGNEVPETAFELSKSEFRQGWTVLLVSAVALMCAPSTMPVYTLGVFVAPLEGAFEWGRREIQTAILFSTGFGALCAPFVGELVERYGARAVVLPALVGMAVGCGAAASMTGALWQFYAAYALMAILGAGVGPIAWSRLVSGAFDRNRGLALGIALSGTGLCAAFMPNYAAFLIDQYGWRAAYVGLGAFVLLIALPLAYLLTPKVGGTDTKQQRKFTRHAPTGLRLRDAIRGRQFWLLAASIVLIYFAIAGAIPNLVPALTAQGLSTEAAAGILGVFGISLIIGRIIVGGLLDRFWAPGVAVIVLAPAVFACFLFNYSLEYEFYIVAGALFGIATGMEFDVLAFLTARYFGLVDYARIYSVLYAILAAVAGVAPMIFGYFYDQDGNYQFVFLIAAAALAMGGLLLLPLGAYPSFSAIMEPIGREKQEARS